MRAPRTLVLALLLPLLATAAAQAVVALPALERGGVLVEAGALARALGVVATASDGVLTWRGATGLVTFFAGSSDVLAQAPGAAAPTDVSLPTPVVREADGWYLPLAALPLLGLEPPGEARPALLTLPDERALPLAYRAEPRAAAQRPPPPGHAGAEPAEAPLAGVRFFDGAGASLLLLDLALVPLAAPGLTVDVDRALDRAGAAGSDHVLLLLVTATAELPWEAALAFEQDGRRLEARHPYRLLVERGSAERVAPGAPVVGAVLLPASFSLYRPLRVEWAGQAAEVRFRR